MEQFVENGLQRSLSIQNQNLKLDQAVFKRTDAWTALLPTLTLSGSRSLSAAESFSSSIKSKTTNWANSLRLSAEWTIWDHFQNVTEVLNQISTVQSERVSLNKESQGYIISLLEAFFELRLLEQRRDNLVSLRKEAGWLLEEAHALVKAGAKSQLDAMDSEIQVQNAERDIQEVDASIATSVRAIQVLLNQTEALDLPKFDLVRDTPYFMSRVAQAATRLRNDPGSAEAISQSPDILLGEQSLDRTLNTYRQNFLYYIPRTSVRAGHEINMDHLVRNSNTDKSAVGPLPLSSTSFTIEFTWPIWDWFKTYRSIASAGKDYDVARNQFRETTLKTRNESLNLVQEYDILSKTYPATKLIVAKAEKQFEYSQSMYTLGRLSLLQMQQAINRLYQARLDLMTRAKRRFVLGLKILYIGGEDLRPIGPSRLDSASPTNGS